ncbi:MAG TPA: hypothetical protein VGS27_07830 [Candidatus Sulfotelmatobacter sp.]|nr:hypothetical protein [Candidatus Sulfotelmatobacter sp.]
MLKKFIVCLTFAVCASSMWAQDTSASTPPMRPGHRGMQSCLEQAGLDRSAIEKLRSIQQDARSQVQNVCANTSLTPQQKRQQVHEIHQQAHQKIEGIITPEEQKTLNACRQQHGDHHPGNFEGVGGGCGGPRGANTSPNAKQTSPQ